MIGRGLHEGVAGDARPARRRGCCLRVPTAAGATGPGRVRRRPGSHRERGPPLSAVVREGPQGAREWSAEGAASPVALRQPVGEPVPHGPARRVVGRAGRPAHAAAVALRARVAQALAQIEALNQRGRGKKRVETVSALRQAVVALIQRDGVDDLVWFRVPPPVTSRPVRASRAQPARVDHDHEATVEGCVAEAAVEATVRRVGWRV